MTKELLLRYLNGDCTPQQLAEVTRWIEDEANAAEVKNLIYSDWQSFEPNDSAIDEEKLELLLDRIHHQLVIEETNTQSGRPFISVMTWLAKAAAIVLLPLLAYWFVSESPSPGNRLVAHADTLEFAATTGLRVLELSDGTVVTLDYGSSIKYPRTFDGAIREVILSGEGYFDVAHNADQPFVVKTKYMDVKVLGTEFNVLANPEKEFVATTLVKGKVVLQHTDRQGAVTNIQSMVPGQHVRYDGETGDVFTETGNIKKYIAWKDGILMFDNTNITDIAEKMERMFNVTFEIDDDIVNYVYTGRFTDEKLTQILDYMTMATPISYKIIPQQQLSDGTRSKPKVIVVRKSD